MKILSWNCRGLGRLRAVEELEEIIDSSKPSVVFLMEVKMGRGVVEGIRVKKEFGGLFYVSHINNGGGLALLWKEQHMVQLLGYGRTFIDLKISLDNYQPWRLIGFYGCPRSSRRRAFWDLITSLNGLHNRPWCILGDFNDIMSSNEKAGRIPQPLSRMVGFSTTMHYCGLQDLGMSGYPYTWERSRGTENWVAERLDRTFANEDWVAMISSAWVENVAMAHSDHSMSITHCLTADIT